MLHYESLIHVEREVIYQAFTVNQYEMKLEL